MKRMIRVMIAHQTRLIGSIIASVLSEEDDVYVVGLASDKDEVLDKLKRSNTNMVLVAATLPNDGALEITKAVAEADPTIKVLVIGMPESESMILQYVMAGAAGYVLQDVPVEQLLDNLRAVHDDKALVSPQVAATLMNQVAELARISSQHELDPEAVAELTPRERDVLNLIGQELTNQEIAERLVIEVGTVKNHVHNILGKLDVSSREEAAAFLPYISKEEDRP